LRQTPLVPVRRCMAALCASLQCCSKSPRGSARRCNLTATYAASTVLPAAQRGSTVCSITPSDRRRARASRAEALELGSDEQIKKRIRLELDDVARKRALQGYEIPRDFIIEREPFSKANHLLTDSGKPATGRLKNTCAPRPRWSTPSRPSMHAQWPALCPRDWPCSAALLSHSLVPAP